MQPLSETETALLEFETEHHAEGPGPKDAAIRAEFGISPRTYYQRLNRLIEKPAALAEFPQLIYALRERRRERLERRTRRVFTDPNV